MKQVLGVLVLVLALAACAGSGMPSGASPAGAPIATSRRAFPAATYENLAYFDGKDGRYPATAPAIVGDTLYGTTSSGGAHNKGVVYSLSKTGTITLLYSFKGKPDGADPNTQLIDMNGTLYGTTSSGGANNSGTFFSVTTAGEEQVLYSFGGTSDSSSPTDLIHAGARLYGSASGGGAHSDGTIFQITTGGHETILYSFTGGKLGASPGNLFWHDGTLYGTASGGKDCPWFSSALSCGTVFGISISGKEVLLYEFKGIPDGNQPIGLAAVNGVLYGATVYGGSGECFLAGTFNPGCGTIFTISRSGKERVIYNFEVGPPSGYWPAAGPIAANGVLYGTTYAGGSGTCYEPSEPGCGTIFSVATSGKQHLLHAFTGKPDGAYPQAGLLDAGGTLYGTASSGGKANDGTVFALKP